MKDQIEEMILIDQHWVMFDAFETTKGDQRISTLSDKIRICVGRLVQQILDISDYQDQSESISCLSYLPNTGQTITGRIFSRLQIERKQTISIDFPVVCQR